MRKKKKQAKYINKSQSFLFIQISTMVGTLILIIAAIPVVLLASHVMDISQKNAQLVEGTSVTDSVGSGQGQTQAIPQGCYPIPCTIMCTTTNPNCCANRFYCPSGTPSPVPSCTPPPCITATPRCLPPVPQGGWCLPTPTVTVSPTPSPGCFYKKICLMTLKVPCYSGDLNCQPCRDILVCPSAIPPMPSVTIPQPSCPPVPPCNPRLGILCKLPEPCMISTTPSTVPSGVTGNSQGAPLGFSIVGFLNSFLKGFFGRPQ